MLIVKRKLKEMIICKRKMKGHDHVEKEHERK